MRGKVDAWYLNRYGKTALLTPAEELILARQIQEAQPLRELPESSLTPQQKRQLRKAFKARQRMIEGNMRLAVNVSRKYLGRTRSMELADLVQEALLGLSIAAERFDHTKGYKFSTYAYWWVRQAITRAIVSRDVMIRIPQHAHDDYVKVKSLIIKALQAGERLTLEQAAEQVGVSMDHLNRAIRAERVSSLNQLAAVDGESEILDLISIDPVQEEDSGLPLFCGEIRQHVDRLNANQAEVIRERFGLTDGKPKTLKAIADKRGVSRERIRQIEATALRKLRIEACRGMAA